MTARTLINVPTGESAQQVAQAQQQLTQAEESLANDKTINSYGATADDQALTNAQDNVDAATPPSVPMRAKKLGRAPAGAPSRPRAAKTPRR